MNILEPRFPLGQTYATTAVTAWAEKSEIYLTRYLRHHHCGEWGDLCGDDKVANEDAIAEGTRIVSAYKINETKIYVITEHDRSRTTIMLATEY